MAWSTREAVRFVSENRLWFFVGFFAVLSVVVNVVVWAIGMAVPTIVSGFVGLRVRNETLGFEALLSSSNPNLVSVAIRAVSYDLSLYTVNNTIRLGKVTYDTQGDFDVGPQSEATIRLPSVLSLQAHPAKCEILRIFEEEMFRLSADGSFRLKCAGITTSEKLRGSEIIPKLNRTAIIPTH